MKKINVGKNAKINVKWKVHPMDYTDAAIENVTVKFAKKYGVPKNSVSIEPVFIVTNKEGEEQDYTNEVIVNIQEPSYQPKLMKEWLEEKQVPDYDFDALMRINDLIDSKINYEKYDKCKRYTIKWIKWDNFMSYGSGNYFDFTSLHDLVRLSSIPANQGGKTTFSVDLLRFLLFGKVTMRQDDWTFSKVFNTHLPEATECVVEGCISIDGEDYVIKRTVTRPSKAKRTPNSKTPHKVNYYRVVNDQYIDLIDEDEADVENMNGANVRQTNKIIKEAIGNERDFDLMICVNRKNLEGLISLKDTERGRLVSRWIGLLPLEEKDKIAREYFNKTIVPPLLLNKYNKEELKGDIEEYEAEIKEFEEANKKNEESQAASEKKLQEYRETRDTLLQSKKDIDADLLKADVETVKSELERVKGEGQKKRAEKANNEKLLKAVTDIEFNEADYKEKVAEDKRLSIELNTKLNRFSTLQKEIEALKKGEYCPTCGAKLANVDNTEKIEQKTQELNNLKEEGAATRTKLNKLEAEIKKLDELRSQYNEKLRLQLVVDKNDVDIKMLIAEYRENERLLKDIQENEEAIANNNRIDTSLNIVNANIQTEEKILRGIIQGIEDNKATIKEDTKVIDKCKDTIKVIEKEEKTVRDWKLYLELIGKNGISKMVLRSVLPMINGGLKNLLSGICDFDVRVDIDDHNDVAFYMIQDEEVMSLGAGSGFEETVASLALRSVLSKISSFSRPSFVVFDEVLGAVGDENYEFLRELYKRIAEDYDFIIHITHLNQIADWHSSHVIVKKENRVSSIETIK